MDLHGFVRMTCAGFTLTFIELKYIYQSMQVFHRLATLQVRAQILVSKTCVKVRMRLARLLVYF